MNDLTVESMPNAVQPFDRQKIDLIKQTVAKGATDLELQLFFHACQRTGLDPLMKQIYAIKRWSSADKREVMSIQTGIDGYRLIADRTGQYGGSDEPVYETSADGAVMKATVTVVKLVKDMPCRFTASARWEEYVQLGRDGQPTSMWKKMPYLMLAKCAEALALRKAFPAELSGVYTHEEMQQADSEAPRTVYLDHQEEKQPEGAAPAARVEGENGQDHKPNVQAQQDLDAPPPSPAQPAFIWRLGKHKGKPITEVPTDYLAWALSTITKPELQDCQDAARMEIDRRQAQDVMQFEEGQG